MSHVVTSHCFGCKYTDCVVVCPVDAFREGDEMLYIDPQVCTCCDLCVPECPVEAIFAFDDVPPEQRLFIAFNAEMASISPPISKKKTPLVQARAGNLPASES